MADNSDSVEPDLRLRNLPNDTIVFVLGILSVLSIAPVLIGSREFTLGSVFVGAEDFALAGVICGISGLLLARKSRKLYKTSPASYFRGSFHKLQYGRIFSIIALTIGGLFLLFIMSYLMLYKYGN